jgi:putative ABC transport system permease protein
MLIYNIRTAFRNLLRFRSHTVISLIGLIIALACVFVVTAWTLQEQQYDRFHKQSESIYMMTTDIIVNNEVANRYPETPAPLAASLRDEIPDIENSCHFVYLYGGRLLKTADLTLKETGIAADSKLLEILDFPILRGSYNSLNEPNSIILTERLAKKIFGSQDPMGQSITFSDSNELMVNGIIRNIPENSSLKFEYFIPYRLLTQDPSNWWQLSDATLIKIRRGSDIKKILPDAQKIFRNNIPDEQYNLNLIPLTELRYGAKFSFFNAEHANRQQLYLFISIAGLIFILACLNYVNLISAHTLKRRKEVGIRKANGASIKILRKFFMTESIILSVTAWFFAYLLARLLIPDFQSIVNVNISSQYLNAGSIAGFFLSIIVVGIISGYQPAIMISSFNPFSSENASNNNPPIQGKLQNAFVLFQFILSISLIIACIVVINQTKFMKDIEVGYDKDSIIHFELPRKNIEDYQAISNDLISDPRVKLVSFAGNSPVNLGPLNKLSNWDWEGLDQGTLTTIYGISADYNFLDVFQIPLIKGRFFTPTGSDINKVVINEKLSRLMGFDNPIGQRMTRDEKQYEIIGIVRDFHFQHPSNDINPFMFTNGGVTRHIFVKINHNAQEVIEKVNNELSRISDEPLLYSYISDQYDNLYAYENKLVKLIITFTLLTIFLACIGLIGLVTYNTETRTKEIGIRKVHGAKVGQVMLLLNQSIIKRLIIGSLISCAISWLVMNKWLNSFHNRIDIGWWIYILSIWIVAAITFLNVSWQTWKASNQNPASTLKCE